MAWIRSSALTGNHHPSLLIWSSRTQKAEFPAETRFLTLKSLDKSEGSFNFCQEARKLASQSSSQSARNKQRAKSTVTFSIPVHVSFIQTLCNLDVKINAALLVNAILSLLFFPLHSSVTSLVVKLRLLPLDDGWADGCLVATVIWWMV